MRGLRLFLDKTLQTKQAVQKTSVQSSNTKGFKLKSFPGHINIFVSP